MKHNTYVIIRQILSLTLIGASVRQKSIGEALVEGLRLLVGVMSLKQCVGALLKILSNVFI